MFISLHNLTKAVSLMGLAWAKCGPQGKSQQSSGTSSAEDGSVKGEWVAANKASAFCWQQKQRFVDLFLIYLSDIQGHSGTAYLPGWQLSRAMGGIFHAPSVMERSAHTKRCHSAESSSQCSKGAQKCVLCS